MDIGQRKLVLVILVMAAALNSCVNDNDFGTIDSISNYNDTVIYFDYTNAINTGFIVPSKSQIASGYFELEFEIVNNTEKTTKYYYKLFYQNESYKFDEKNWDGSINPLCEENFYGSYVDVGIGFRATDELIKDEMITVMDSIRIVGNPRNEEKYFGNTTRYFKEVPKDKIQIKVEEIKKSKDWYC